MSDILDALKEIKERLTSIEEDIGILKEQSNSIRSLVGPFSAVFPNGDMLCQTIHGIKYFIDSEDLVIAPQMVVYRQWEAELSGLFRQLCTPDAIVIDVGANFGYFTCLAGSLIGNGGSGRVFAFEPNPKLATLLRKNLEINWSMAPIEFHEAAVTDFTGTVSLHIPDAHSANASLSAFELGKAGESVVVQSLLLDNVIPPQLAIDLLKIDVEGHELSVLKGAKALIARSPNLRIIMEWSRPQMQQAGIDPTEILNVLDDFKLYDVDVSDNSPESTKNSEWLLAQNYVNVMFVRN